MNTACERNLFGSGVVQDLHDGFSDDLIERLCSAEVDLVDAHLPRRRSPWLYWTAEIYGFGWCYRSVSGWPRLLPLPIYGDHGVDLCGVWAPHEIEARPKSFFTWNKYRAATLERQGQKRVVRIVHPWVLYRKKLGIERSADAFGTIAFIPHTLDGVEFADQGWNLYKETLLRSGLPEPIVLCVHMHDVRKGLHHHLRSLGLPIVSLGNTSSPYFVDRFYSVIGEFEMATSPSPGSELFYCEEFKTRFLISGKSPERISKGRSDFLDGPLHYFDDLQERDVALQNTLFGELTSVACPERESYIADRLGLDLDFKTSIFRLRKILLREFPRHFGAFLKLASRRLLHRKAQRVSSA